MLLKEYQEESLFLGATIPVWEPFCHADAKLRLLN